MGVKFKRNTQWVRNEIAWALENEKHLAINDMPFILPVRLSPFEWPQELSFLSDLKYADLTDDFETGVTRLIAAMM